MADLKDLEKRTQILEDIQEIEILKAKCSLYGDLKDGDKLATCFTEDGSFGSKIMQMKGHDELRKTKFWPFMVHYSLNSIVAVDGDKGTGKWYFFRPHTTHENVARWAGGYYDDVYVRDGGRWKFKSIRLTNWFLTEYDKGFAKDRGADPQINEKYETDK